MMRPIPPKFEIPFWALVTGLGYFVMASLSLYATKGADNIAAVWPPSGFALAMLLLMPARSRIAALVAIAVASISTNMLSGTSLSLSVAFTSANVTEGLIALWVINRREIGVLSFMVPRSVGNFSLAVLFASGVSAAIATLLAGKDLNFFWSWFSTALLGSMIVTPPIVMLLRLASSGVLQSVGRATMIEAAAILTGVAAVTIACFAQSVVPVIFLPYVAIVAATIRLGPFGAAASVMLVAIIASWLTGQGFGPIAASDIGPKFIVLFLQFYLLVMLFATLPLAALLIVRKRLARRLEESNRWLLQAEAVASVGHWYANLAERTVRLSDQAYRTLGVEAGVPMTVESCLDNYVAEDAERLSATLEQSALAGEPFEFEGRIQRSNGDIHHVRLNGSVEFDCHEIPAGVFGTIQDITATVENARMLEAARTSAEAAANTDMLTGLPNRRHTLAVLEEAIVTSQATGAPLAVAILDIDHFKQVNDVHGHAVGDEVIRCVGQRAKASLREDDMVGRFGGEEFVCIFQGSSAHAAQQVAERVRAAIENEKQVETGSPEVTVSIGLAVYDGNGSGEDVLRRADEALYEAKREGRNQLRLAA